MLRHRALTIVLILSLCGACVPLYFRIGSEFFPTSDESQISITLRAPIGTRVERTEEVATRIEAVVNKNLQTGIGIALRTLTRTWAARVGARRCSPAATGPHLGSVQINLAPQRAHDRGSADHRQATHLREGFAGVQTFFSPAASSSASSTSGLQRRSMSRSWATT